MKKNIILSAVAATVVTGALMLGGCVTNSSKAPAYNPGQKAEGTISVVMNADGTVKAGSSVVAKGNSDVNLGGGYSNSKVTVKTVRDCVDANQQPAPCTQVCTEAKPCDVIVTTACTNDSGENLNYANTSDFIGAFHEYNNSGDPEVVAVRNDATLAVGFSGVINVVGTGIGSCGFGIDTYVVCVLMQDGTHAWNISGEDGNTAGYVLVLAEFADGTKEWKKVEIVRGTNNGENQQPGVSVDFDGKVPAKITVMSVLRKGRQATGASGSTGATI